MGATVVDTSVNSANWTKQKPADYNGKDLDKALKTYEGLVSQGPSVPASLPTMPKMSGKELGACIKTLESAIDDMKKAVAFLKKLGDALKAVNSAATKTSAELQKLAKDMTGDAKNKYLSAASAAAGIGAQASSSQQKIE